MNVIKEILLEEKSAVLQVNCNEIVYKTENIQKPKDRENT